MGWMDSWWYVGLCWFCIFAPAWVPLVRWLWEKRRA